jgi:hypothetical protein
MVRIRNVDINDSYNLACIHVSSWKRAYLGIVPDDILDNMNIEKRKVYFDRVIEL